MYMPEADLSRLQTATATMASRKSLDSWPQRIQQYRRYAASVAARDVPGTHGERRRRSGGVLSPVP
jgi:hypothetical protein